MKAMVLKNSGHILQLIAPHIFKEKRQIINEKKKISTGIKLSHTMIHTKVTL